MKALKEEKLRLFCQCNICNKKIGQLIVPIFWIVKSEQHGLKIDAVKRKSGLESMFNGNVLIANTFGTDEDMTEPFTEYENMICNECFVKRLPELFN